MALTDSNFVTVFAGPVVQLHMYTTTDAIATVIASGHFDAITNKLRNGDMILVSSSTGGTIATDLITVSSATGAATVTTTNGT